jgi:hypothetical protein
MQLNKLHKIETAAAKKLGRYAWHGVRFTEGRATATDGRVLAIVPCEPEDGDDAHGQIVPVDALKDARKIGAGVRVNGTIEACGRTYAALEGEYPQIEGALGTVSEDSHVVFSLDPKLLRNLFDAMAAGGKVTLAVPRDPDAPVLVCAVEGGGFGAIMGVRIDNAKERLSERHAWAAAVK